MASEGVDHAHVHHHAGHATGWGAWWSTGGLRAVLVAVVAAGLAAAAGLVVLWPSGEGRAAAVEAARELGLATDRYRATVTGVSEGRCSFSAPGAVDRCRRYTVTVDEGPSAGQVIDLGEFSLAQPGLAPSLGVGDRIIVGHEPSTDFWFYVDRDRRDVLVWLGVVFGLAVVALGRWRGVTALVSMALTVVLLVGFVAPAVLDGRDPVAVCLVAAAVVAFGALYLTHGFGPVTTVALAGTLGALVLTWAASEVFYAAARISGLATEEGLTLPLLAEGIDLPGLLLGGAVLGALGALDDVTVTQVATVAEIHHRNPALPRRALVVSGIRVGREHIASAVNTLLLAYAGASMPLLLLFAVSEQPWGVVASSEVIAVEIIRTLCGSLGLVAAVPVTTALAAAVVAGPSPARRPHPRARQPGGADPAP